MSERERLSARDLECRPNCFGSSVPIPVTIYMCYVPAEMGSVQSSQKKKFIQCKTIWNVTQQQRQRQTVAVTTHFDLTLFGVVPMI